MSATLQTVIALAAVAAALVYLVSLAIRKRRQPGCGDNCGAVSPEVKRLQARLRR
ncbi:MAG TPA: hypothetical protein VGM73_07330 [Candidatus Didemnitutus sp.]|jgi:hypothetical protein